MRFDKYQGLGNHFILLEDPHPPITPDDAKALCDRHFGIGADGVLIIGTDPPSMILINADGSRPEMCGNGLRCVAQYLRDMERVTQRAFSIQTDAGPYAVELCDTSVRVAMPFPTLSPTRQVDSPWGALYGTPANTGNPHLVLFDWPDVDLDVLGRHIQNDPLFPAGINVSFAQLGESITLRVWERGVGLTMACGTGACATAAVVRAQGKCTDNPLTINLPGGKLSFEWTNEWIWMAGPATQVFSGEIKLPKEGG